MQNAALESYIGLPEYTLHYISYTHNYVFFMYTALVLFSATHVQDGCLWQQRNGDKNDQCNVTTHQGFLHVASRTLTVMPACEIWQKL